ncbi:hypothetical protein [Streptomyces sp. NPDC004230]
MNHRPTAEQITNAELAALYERLEKQTRALDRANALTDGWAGDMTETTRSAAADLFASVIELDGWDQTDAPIPARHLTAVPAPDAGPTVREAADHDRAHWSQRQWGGE